MGALTNKPMAFNSRNWEYQSQLIHDITDFLTPRIRVDQFNGKVYRILPTVEWISNRIRFLYLGLRNQRINTPLATYLVVLKIALSDRTVFLDKKVLSMITYETAFTLLKTRLLVKGKKSVNLVYGSLFDADPTVFQSFETNETKIFHHFEINYSKKIHLSKMLDLQQQFQVEKNESLILFGVNPRMESPLLNLKIKELEIEKIFSFGNLSYSYPVQVLSNNTGFSLYLKKGLLSIRNSVMVFGLSTLNLINFFADMKKITLIPVYLLNNFFRYSNNESVVRDKGNDDVNVYLSNQNLLTNEVGFNFILSSHFENLTHGIFNSVNIPVASYLETNLKFFDKDLKLVKINSLKPNFNLNDCLSAFKLFVHCKNNSSKKGNLFLLPTKKRIQNILVNDSIPNYLIRDPLGRANPLFNSITRR